MAEPLARLCLHHLEAVGVERCGFGPDPYDSEPRHHAMAYALYARGLVSLYRATGDVSLLQAAEAIAQRLSDLSVGSPPGWGLPFSWQGCPAGHPYAITTALCGHSMLELFEAGGSSLSIELLGRACTWLVDGVEWSYADSTAAPWFAPGMPDVVVNVASQAGGLLVAASRIARMPQVEERGFAALRLVADGQHGLGYWTYRPAGSATAGALNDSSIDAVHTAYVLDGLIAAARFGARRRIPGLRDSVASGLRFALDNLFDRSGLQVRKLVAASLDSPQERRLIEAAPDVLRYAPPRRWLAPYPGAAPLWGYGGMLGAVGRALRVGVSELDRALPLLERLQATALRRVGGRFPYSPDDPGPYPRHEAHVFDGLAAFAEVCER
jgi:hypothetical protein